MTYEDWRILLFAWISIGFIIYIIFALDADFETPDFLEDLSRKKRILYKLGVIFLWPVLLPLVIIVGMISIVVKTIKSIFI